MAYAPKDIIVDKVQSYLNLVMLVLLILLMGQNPLLVVYLALLVIIAKVWVIWLLVEFAIQGIIALVVL